MFCIQFGIQCKLSVYFKRKINKEKRKKKTEIEKKLTIENICCDFDEMKRNENRKRLWNKYGQLN